MLFPCSINDLQCPLLDPCWTYRIFGRNRQNIPLCFDIIGSCCPLFDFLLRHPTNRPDKKINGLSHIRYIAVQVDSGDPEVSDAIVTHQRRDYRRGYFRYGKPGTECVTQAMKIESLSERIEFVVYDVPMPRAFFSYS